jgi:membrane associated rhomboid family serine protease
MGFDRHVVGVSSRERPADRRLVETTEWTEVYTSRIPGPCDERAFVLLAVGIPALMRSMPMGFGLIVRASDAARATAELDRYARENRSQPVVPPVRLHAGALASALGYVLVIFLIGVTSTRSFGRVDWYDAGVLDGVRLRSGELWRALTALTLHADLAHLVGNAIFGALFGGLATRVYGVGVGWLLILVAAATANLVNGALMPVGRESLGASTAVFAALGALAVHRWPVRRPSWASRLAGRGVLGAVVLLGMLGTGDRHTDVAAHALGFLCGMLFGLPLRSVAPPAGRLQFYAVAGTLGLLVMAWAVALTRMP